MALPPEASPQEEAGYGTHGNRKGRKWALLIAATTSDAGNSAGAASRSASKSCESRVVFAPSGNALVLARNAMSGGFGFDDWPAQPVQMSCQRSVVIGQKAEPHLWLQSNCLPANHRAVGGLALFSRRDVLAYKADFPFRVSLEDCRSTHLRFPLFRRNFHKTKFATTTGFCGSTEYYSFQRRSNLPEGESRLTAVLESRQRHSLWATRKRQQKGSSYNECDHERVTEKRASLVGTKRFRDGGSCDLEA